MRVAPLSVAPLSVVSLPSAVSAVHRVSRNGASHATARVAQLPVTRRAASRLVSSGLVWSRLVSRSVSSRAASASRPTQYRVSSSVLPHAGPDAPPFSRSREKVTRSAG
jgi:hypothetical protein